MSVTFKAFLECIKPVTDARLPILLRSRHGQGKSSVVYQIAKSFNLPIIERRASQMTEGDLLGLPKVDGDRTEWLPPAWLKTACEEACVLFVDEIDRATIEVRQGFFELTDSRKIAGNFLHKDTLIFAAINGGEHTAQYQVGELDPAELDRWVVFDLEPSVEDWLTWAKQEVNEVVWDFINSNHNLLEHQGNFEPNKVYPSRRSWHRFSNVVKKGNFLEAGKPSPVLYNIASGFLGIETAIAFNDFVKNYQAVVTWENIINEGKIDLTKKWGISEHTAFVEKCHVAKVWASKLSNVQIENLVKYFKNVPSEPAMKLFQNLSLGDVENIKRFHGHSDIAERIVEFVVGPAKEEKKEETKEGQPVKRGPGRPKKSA